MRLRFAILLPWLALALTAAAAAPPPDLDGFAYRQRLGNQLPLDTVFRDETGRTAPLRNLLGGKPAVLALVYFHCPNLCGIVRSDLFDALAKTGMIAGRDYTLIALSIDPSETVADAKAAKADDLSRYPLPGGQQASHFLTGSADSVRAIADAVGFRDRYRSRAETVPASRRHCLHDPQRCRFKLSARRRVPARRCAARRDAGQSGQHRLCGFAGTPALFSLRSTDRPLHARHHETAAARRLDHRRDHRRNLVSRLPP